MSREARKSSTYMPAMPAHGKAHSGNRYLTEKRSLARAPRALLTEKRILHMTAHSTSPSGIVELCKPGGRPRVLRCALPLRTAAPRPPPVACATM